MIKMDKNSNLYEKNDKEKLLEKLDINNSQEVSNYIERQSPNIIEDGSSTISEKYKKEKLGLFVSALSVLFGSCGSIYTKIIQKAYPEDFRTVQFLFLRSFTVYFFALFHSRIRNEKIMNLRDIPEKKWFFLRTNANFFGVACITVALWYLRASTAIIIQNVHPLFVLTLSYFVLKEKFYIRYIIGIIICFFGALIMVLNESKVKVNDMKVFTNAERSFGLFFSFIDLFFISSVKVANKIMVNKKVPVGTQMYYVSLSTMLYSSIYTIFFGGLCFKPGYLLMCLVHGIFFYLSNIIQNFALQLCPLTKYFFLYINKVLKINGLWKIKFKQNNFGTIFKCCLYIFIIFYIFKRENIFF